MIQTTVSDKLCSIKIPPLFTVVETVHFVEKFKEVCENNSSINKINLDFSQTNFMDSSGIGTLVVCRKIAQKKEIDLALSHVSAPVMMALSLTALDQIFTIERAQDAPNEPVSRQNTERLIATHPSVNSRAKRIIDIVGSLVGLAITSILFIPIALAITLDNPGPIFFHQERCSWMGKRFKIWKFRSMVVNAEALKAEVKNEVDGPLFKNKNDPRITKVGRFLRKSSLDELPQFWNVLKGEMSLVGTRPPTPKEIEAYEIPQWQRLDVKPGMTGEWQVNGRSSVTSFEDVIKMDLQYQENWSLMYDIKLIFKTITVLFDKRSGAY
ncbi:MAG: exopolysaccharide biosynthesis polyprenyl glycosylphosphotransferase [Elainellaceae cyanobacterium]